MTTRGILANTPTRYEVAYQSMSDASRTTLGYIARHSAAGMLAFVQGSSKAQTIIETLPEDCVVTRERLRWCIAEKNGRIIGHFIFTGRTERHPL
jgi:hypothetical protein